MDHKQYLRNLYPKLLDQTISNEELSWLQEYFERSEPDDLYTMINAELQLSDEHPLSEPTALEIKRGIRIYNHLEQEIRKDIVPVPKLNLWPRIAVAAAIIMAIAAGVFFYANRSVMETVQTAAYANDVAPGRQSATLTLANGKKIRLTDAADGELAKEAGVVISKSANGQLIYEIKNADPESNKINILSTARGETYQVRLPDGSLVWLNAASSLTYAANLNAQGKRHVKLNGEAYFEIAKDKTRPFIVESTGQLVEVLGTHFNINGYADKQDLKTTLLEGSIKISSGSEYKIIKPGQQSIIRETGIQVKDVIADDAIAWKNGYFMFDNETLENILIKISRWYNIEISYVDPSVKTETFFGTISRYENISKILNMLERTGVVKFSIRGNLISVARKE